MALALVDDENASFVLTSEVRIVLRSVAPVADAPYLYGERYAFGSLGTLLNDALEKQDPPIPERYLPRVHA